MQTATVALVPHEEQAGGHGAVYAAMSVRLGSVGPITDVSPVAGGNMQVTQVGGSVTWSHADNSPLPAGFTGSVTSTATNIFVNGSCTKCVAFDAGWQANTIRSDEGQGDSRSEFVDVVAGGPTAAFTVNPNPRLPGQYQFVSESTDPAGGALTESWVFGDGSSGTGRVITHTYAKPGSYPVTLTARNGQGKGASVTKTVVVKPPTLGVGIEVVGGPTSVRPGRHDEGRRHRVGEFDRARQA